MSRHNGVRCDVCLKSNFKGRRYVCLICRDYDLCAVCYEAGAMTWRHMPAHPMQCILTRSDCNLHYGGENLPAEQIKSFTCPYCGKMGFSVNTLQDHVASEHVDSVFEVVCPVCIAIPGKEASVLTEDFVGHLTLHHSGSRELDEFLSRPIVRRIPHSPTRCTGGSRTYRSNSHFRSAGVISSLSSQARDIIDPITELLSQISGVRWATINQSSTNLLDQDQPQPFRNEQIQLERLPRRQAAQIAIEASCLNSNSSNNINSSNNSSTALQSQSTPITGLMTATTAKDIPRLILPTFLKKMKNTEEYLQKNEQKLADRSLFVQELVLKILCEVPVDKDKIIQGQ